MSARQLGRFSSQLYPHCDGAGYLERLERFDPIAFAELESDTATQRAEASALGLEEIFIALVGENSGDER